MPGMIRVVRLRARNTTGRLAEVRAVATIPTIPTGALMA
jgi:hypothetical protein